MMTLPLNVVVGLVIHNVIFTIFNQHHSDELRVTLQSQPFLPRN